MASELELQQDEKFMKTIDEIVDAVSMDSELQDIPDALDWMKIVLENNIHGGKQNRAKACVNFVRKFKKDCTEEDEKLSFVAAWCAEIWQAAALMADDIMDSSETRRGKLCWYKHEEIGLSAINDSFMLENIVYQILWKFFSHKSYFQPLLKQSNRLAFYTIMGQCLDMRTSVKRDFKMCTLENYKRIVKYKTSLYSFYSPAATAMIMADMTDEAIFEAVKDLTILQGYLFQVQDDYLDCYGNPEITGKIGTDIIDGKCTWLLVNAIEMASTDQRKTLEICYGSKAEEDEETVKRIYDDLNLKARFHAFEAQTYAEINRMIKLLPPSLPGRPFQDMLNNIYKRKK